MGGLTKNTVFVLGACASSPYGYPTGFQLNKFIKFATTPILDGVILKDFILRPVGQDKLPVLKNVNNPYYIEILDILNSQRKIDPFLLHNFHSLFSEASMNSIDEFIAKFNHFEEIGKILICQRIMRCENLQVINSIDDWYSELWSILISSGGKHLDHNFRNSTFVSFNYDRSFEFFLYQKLLALFEYNTSSADKYFAENVKIIHPYGRICDFTHSFNLKHNAPYQDYGFHYKKYLSNYSHVFVEYAKNIHVIGDRTNINLTEEIQTYIRNSAKVVFLGFGFNQENLNILKISTQEIHGTWYKLHNHIKQDFKAQFREHDLYDCEIKEYFIKYFTK